MWPCTLVPFGNDGRYTATQEARASLVRVQLLTLAFTARTSTYEYVRVLEYTGGGLFKVPGRKRGDRPLKTSAGTC